MKLGFFLAAAAMIAVALVLLLAPLIRQGRRHGRSPGVFIVALAVAFLLPAGTAGLYLLIGTPVALNGVEKQPEQMSIDQALAQLRTHLEAEPKDTQGWLLLAQTYGTMRRPGEARDAYDQVLRLESGNTAAMVGWAEMDSIVRPDHRIDGRSLELLEHAVQQEPDNQRGLWLLGISQFQHDHFAEAAATWRKLEPLLEPGSTVAKAVAEQIAAADARAGGTPASQETPAAEGTSLQVQVALAPALKSKLGAGDTLFVYARAEQGPPMPLAVARIDAAALPATVTLTDAMSMTPQLKLSSAKRVFVGARVSKSGQAIAQPGDLEGDAGVVDVSTTVPLKIEIDKVH